MGKLLLSHRYNLLPLLRSRPGGVERELVVKDLPATKVVFFYNLPKFTLNAVFILLFLSRVRF